MLNSTETIQMLYRFGRLRLLVAAICVTALASAAEAGMIPVAVSVTPQSGQFRWTYGVEVTTDVKVNTGDSFTIYDFGGLVNGSVMAPANWTFSSANSGPMHSDTNPHDSAAIPNLTFTYTGTTALPGQQGLGNFSALSTFGTSMMGDFTSGVHRQIDNRLEDNITTTNVPNTTPAGSGGTPGGGSIAKTPEPTTLVLLGTALPLLGALRAWRLRRKKDGVRFDE